MSDRSFNIKKVAIIADVHGNLTALNLFMKFINEEKIEMVLNLGDFIGIGPNPAETTQIILNDKRFISILGNHETSKFLNEEYGVTSEEQAHHRWILNQLSPDLLEKIKIIPKQRYITINSLKFYLIHSRPYEKMAPMIDGMPILFMDKNIRDFVKDYQTASMSADWILFGHTHLPLFIDFLGKKYLCPGALGVSAQKLITFAIIDFSNGMHLSIQQIPYDPIKEIQEIKRKNIPDAEKIIEVFYGGC